MSSLSTGDEAVTCSAVEVRCLLRSSGSAWSGCWLGWRIRCIVLHTSFGRLKESAVIINDRLAFLIRFLSLFRLYLGMSHATSWGGRACASWRWLARFTCTERILGSFSQGAGDRVTFVLFSGACLLRHSEMRRLKVAILSLSSSTAYTISNGRAATNTNTQLSACILSQSVLEHSRSLQKNYLVALRNNCVTWWNVLGSSTIRMSAWLSSLEISRSSYLQQQLLLTPSPFKKRKFVNILAKICTLERQSEMTLSFPFACLMSKTYSCNVKLHLSNRWLFALHLWIKTKRLWSL